MRSTLSRSDAGFSLIEILVALLILAGGLLAVAQFDGLLTQGFALSEQRTEATLYAQQKIERLRSYTVMSDPVGHTGYNDMTNGSDVVTGTSAVFTRTWTVTRFTDVAAPQYTRVVVAMTWKDNGGQDQSISLTTNIAANNPVHAAELITPPPS